jgi:predicted Fe-S protein YdhL (DUF1289 family)
MQVDGIRDMGKIATPCKQICALDTKKQICKTCKRTEEEIAGWLDYTPAQRKAVMKRIKEKISD